MGEKWRYRKLASNGAVEGCAKSVFERSTATCRLHSPFLGFIGCVESSSFPHVQRRCAEVNGSGSQ